MATRKNHGGAGGTAALLVLALAGPAAADEVAATEIRLASETSFRDPDAGDYGRLRLRFRLAGEYQMAEWLVFGGRIATGDPEDPRDPYADLGAGFRSFPIGLDRAYVRVEAGKKLRLYGGKFGHVAQATPALWDEDVQPTGVAAAATLDGPAETRIQPAAFFYLIDKPLGGRAAYLAGGQVKAGRRVGYRLRVAAASAVYAFENVDVLAARGAGNTVVVGDDGELAFAERFLVVDNLVEVELIDPGPMRVFANVFVNPRAARARTGVQLGVEAGRLGRRGGMITRYAISDVGRDATVAALAQDEIRLSTGYRGHEFHLGYEPREGVRFFARAYHFREKVSGAPSELRGRLDVEASF